MRRDDAHDREPARRPGRRTPRRPPAPPRAHQAASTAPQAPIQQALPHMTPADRAETLAILGRLGDIGEPPETTEARQQILLNLASSLSSARSSVSSGLSFSFPDFLAVFTQFPSVPSLVPRSRAISAIGRPELITSSTASSLYSWVYFLRACPTSGSLLVDHRATSDGVYGTGRDCKLNGVTSETEETPDD